MVDASPNCHVVADIGREGDVNLHGSMVPMKTPRIQGKRER